MNIKKIPNLFKDAILAAEESPDKERQVGAALYCPVVDDIIMKGCNRFVEHAPTHKLPTSGDEKHDFIVHAEQALLSKCAKRGISTNNCILFITLSPCATCARLLYYSGIREVYFLEDYKDLEKQIENMKDLNIKLYRYNNFNKMELCPAIL